MDKELNIKNLTLMGVFIALIFTGTYIIKIPTPSGGYIHLGDSMVLVAAVILGPKKGALVSGIGMAFADIISGYMIYAPFTFVIKALMAFTAATLIYKVSEKNIQSYVKGFIPASVVMVVGYFLTGIIINAFLSGGESNFISSISVSLKDILPNILQATVGAIIAIPLCELVLKSKRMFV